MEKDGLDAAPDETVAWGDPCCVPDCYSPHDQTYRGNKYCQHHYQERQAREVLYE